MDKPIEAIVFTHSEIQRPYRAFVLDNESLWEFSAPFQDGEIWEGTKTVFSNHQEAFFDFNCKRHDLESDGYVRSSQTVDHDCISEKEMQTMCYWRISDLSPVGTKEKVMNFMQMVSDEMSLKFKGKSLTVSDDWTLSIGHGLKENQLSGTLQGAGSLKEGCFRELAVMLGLSKYLKVEFANDQGEELKLGYFDDVVNFLNELNSNISLEQLKNFRDDCEKVGFIQPLFDFSSIVSEEQNLYF